MMIARKFAKYLFLIKYCLICNITFSAPYFNYLTVEDGLSNSSVLSILQDSRGFVWLGTRDGLNRYDGTRVKVYRDFFSKNPRGANVKVNCIAEDENHDLWVGTNNGLYFYNTDKDLFTPVLYYYIYTVFKDDKKNLWVGTNNGLYLLRRPLGLQPRLTYMSYKGKDSIAFRNIQSIVQDGSGRFILGTPNGLFLLKIENGNVSVSRPRAMQDINVITLSLDSLQNIWVGSNTSGLFRTNRSLTNIHHFFSGNTSEHILDNNVRKVFTDRKGNVWIGTLKGLNRFNPNTVNFDSWVHEPANIHSLNYNSIYDLYQDRQGSLWIGTYYGGANIIEAQSSNFVAFKNEQHENSLSSNIISAISGTQDGNLWVGTEAEGLNYFNLSTGQVLRFNTANKKFPTSNLVKTVYRDHSNTLWVGMFGGGVNFSNNHGKSFEKLDIKNNRLNSNDVTSIIEDDKQRLWVGQQDYGINILTRDRKSILNFNSIFSRANLADNGITCLYRNSKNDVFIGTRSGVFLLGYNNNDSLRKVEKIFPAVGQNTYINCITEDSLHKIWIGSASGLCSYDAIKKQYILYGLKDGLPSDRIMGIVPDGVADLWLSTTNGISKFNIESRHFTNYNKHDGLPSRVFNYNSFFKDKRGYIFFGSLDGLVSFKPTEIEINKKVPEIILTDLSVNNKNITAHDSSGILSNSLSAAKLITLRHYQSDIAIEYAVLNFIKPKKNISAYTLNGYNNGWVTNNQQKAVFTGLQPGTYQLLIKASNNDGIWSGPMQVLKIIVLPPLWKTWWAYAGYALIGLLSIMMVFRFLNSRAALKRKLHFEHELNLQQQELQKMKSDFFTFMSHELRTPLTLISGPAEIILDNSKQNSVEKKLAASIKSNSDRMLNIVNNLMDFMKADSGALKLKLTTGDIVDHSKNIFEKFKLAAKEKNIEYSFKTEVPAFEIEFDRHYMEIVLSNLLSNAIKFVPANGRVMMGLNMSVNHVEVCICDNGPGIPENDAENIFTKFFQVNPESEKKKGSGIGLMLSKKLMELHGGSIAFKREPLAGFTEEHTCFIVYLRKDNNAFPI